MRPELTVQEKAALGRLIASWQRNETLKLDPADPSRSVFEGLTKRGGWVELEPDGSFKITNYGMNAFYTGRIVRG